MGREASIKEAAPEVLWEEMVHARVCHIQCCLSFAAGSTSLRVLSYSCRELLALTLSQPHPLLTQTLLPLILLLISLGVTDVTSALLPLVCDQSFPLYGSDLLPRDIAASAKCDAWALGVTANNALSPLPTRGTCLESFSVKDQE